MLIVHFSMAQGVKNPPSFQENSVQSLGQEDCLEAEVATHSSILAWKIPWTEEPGGLQSMGWNELDLIEPLRMCEERQVCVQVTLVQLSRSVMSDSMPPVDCSTAGFTSHYKFQQLVQNHVHRVGDTIQLYYPLSSPFPPAFNLSQDQGFFQWVFSSHHMTKLLELQPQLQSFQWIFRTNLL